jgi:glycosyltransferase involved in cell wall biosynthesis
MSGALLPNGEPVFPLGSRYREAAALQLSMRFAYLSCDFGVNPFGGIGNSVHLQEIVRALRGLGHEVEVFSSVSDPDGGKAGQVHSVPLRGLPYEVTRCLKREDAGLPRHLAVEWRRLFYAEYVQRELLPLLADFKPDVIYERYSLFAYGGLGLAAALGVPLLLEVNAPLSQEAARYRDLVLKRTAAELERRIFVSADAVLVVSRELEAYARRLGVSGEKLHVVPNAADPTRFHPDASGEGVRARYGLEGKRVIGFVGGLRLWHDLDTLLDALELLAARHTGAHLLVVGKGPASERLEKRGAEHITFTGAVDYDEVPRFMAAMDVVVVPYSAEIDCYFSPLKLFEAMAMAKPVVGARIGQVAEILVEGETGLLYEPGQALDLADRIEEALAPPDHGRVMGAAARAWVVATRSWEQNALEIERVATSLREQRGAE